jgi:hypothetical protein
MAAAFYVFHAKASNLGKARLGGFLPKVELELLI